MTMNMAGRNYYKIGFFALLTCLVAMVLYYLSFSAKTESGFDLCELRKGYEDIKPANHGLEWWEHACIIEEDWDYGKEYRCQDKRKIGNYKVCFDEVYKPSPPCIVYSFGIDNDFRFDDGMAELGCQVFSFDPSMGVASHRRSERVEFFNIGLSTKDDDHFVPILDAYVARRMLTWSMKTLKSIKKMLGHEKKTVDILKIDIETYEWPVMAQLLEDGSLDSVRQLLIEWHIFPNEPMRTEFKNMHKVIDDMRSMGFQHFHSSNWARHHTYGYFNSQQDMAYVKYVPEKNERQHD